MNNPPSASAKPALFSSASGFTMLEILMAIVIFALVITMVFGSFRAVFSSVDALGGNVVTMASVRTCISRMTEDLSSLYVATYPRYKKPVFDDDPDPYRFMGDDTVLAGTQFGRLQFTSLAHLAINGDSRQGICRVIYYVHQRPDRTLVLRRADDLFPFPAFEESEDHPILCDAILGLRFEYVDPDGEIVDHWDSDSDDNDYATPQSVLIHLTLGDPERPVSFTQQVPLYVHRDSIK